MITSLSSLFCLSSLSTLCVNAGCAEYVTGRGPPLLLDGYTFVGTGWCLDASKDDGAQYFPALYQEGALLQNPEKHTMELKEMCDKNPDCVGIDLYNDDTNGYLLFRSVAALDAIVESGWDKWSPSSAMEEGVCIADDCTVTASEIGEGSGQCYAKTGDA